jgi:hypothetical protein
MQRLHYRLSSRVALSLLAAAGIALTACSSGGSGNTTSASPTAPPASQSSAPAAGSEPATGSGAENAIKKNWATFFSASTPASRRISLLQDGDKLAGTIKTQSKGNPLAKGVSAKVTHITLTGTNQASVTYSIFVSGQPVLPDAQGVAIYQNGVWKVGLVSFCALLKLENAGKSSGLPVACKGS